MQLRTGHIKKKEGTVMTHNVVSLGETKSSPEEKPQKEYHRTPWSGNLDEDEITKPGGLLLAALIQAANERRQQLNDMARDLGVTYGYINQLRNGIRSVNQVSDDFALACATYLEVPRITVLMLAGRITPADAFEDRNMMAAELARAMKFICDDPKWGPLMTMELRNATPESSYAIIRMYEAATGKVLMATHIDLPTLAKEIESLREIQDNRREKLKDYVSRKSAPAHN
jgi:transcriptional regulator with XRE-family HTH domain